MLKQLTGRPLDIVSGNTELPLLKVIKYRELYALEGYDLPHLEISEADAAAGYVVNKSTVGTRIRLAIETAADFKMQCGHLLSYLRTLNKLDNHDAASIVSKLLTELELPSVCRTKIGSIENQRTWLEQIVAEVLR